MKSKKEEIYDDQVAPLMTEIIRICKASGINMFADYCLGPDPAADDEPLFCTTCLSTPKQDDHDRIMKYRSIATAPAFAFTVITEKG